MADPVTAPTPPLVAPSINISNIRYQGLNSVDILLWNIMILNILPARSPPLAPPI